jgi:6-phosphofructokinase 1
LKVLILTSGGDAPGMNACVHYITKFLPRKTQVFASKYGFQGLLDNNIEKIDTRLTSQHKNKAGSFIKSSRCLEFKKEKGFNKALKTLKKRKIDVVIILGGDGSLKGAQSLALAGINVVLIPSTIDRDLPYETYSIGFDTAADAATKYIESVKPTMEAFDRICIYEIMGRDDTDLTMQVARNVQADFVLTKKTLHEIDFDVVRKKCALKPHLTICLQEKLLPIEKVVEVFEAQTQNGVRACVVGYIQRGTAPTKTEMLNAKRFARFVVKQIKQKQFNFAVALDGKKASKIKF